MNPPNHKATTHVHGLKPVKRLGSAWLSKVFKAEDQWRMTVKECVEYLREFPPATKKTPRVIIYGSQPGVGKSTLIEAIRLHFRVPTIDGDILYTLGYFIRKYYALYLDRGLDDVLLSQIGRNTVPNLDCSDLWGYKNGAGDDAVKRRGAEIRKILFQEGVDVSRIRVTSANYVMAGDYNDEYLVFIHTPYKQWHQQLERRSAASGEPKRTKELSMTEEEYEKAAKDKLDKIMRVGSPGKVINFLNIQDTFNEQVQKLFTFLKDA